MRTGILRDTRCVCKGHILEFNKVAAGTNYFFYYVHLFLGERERAQGWGGGDRGKRETQNQTQVPGSELSAWGLNPRWEDHDLS